MRLKKHLTEIKIPLPHNIDVDEIIKMLEKDSGKYIKELKKTKTFLMRGSFDFSPWSGKGYTKKQARLKDRVPRNSNKHFHDYLNQLFMNKFKWPVRNGVFAASQSVGIYGSPALFFPIGDYKYAWSPEYKDLFNIIPSFDRSKPKEQALEYMKKHGFDKNFKKAVATYKDKDLKGAMRVGQEVSFNTKGYYLVTPVVAPQLAEKWGIDTWNLDNVLRMLQ